MTEHTVTFLSPGTFVSESTERDIDSWDVPKACLMAKEINERYNAKPYGFRFTTYVTAPDVPDGEGGTLKVERREKASSGLYILGGKVISYDEIDDKDENRRILKSNMRCNGYPLIFENTNSWMFTYFFTEKDKIVNPENGETIEDGADQLWTECRKRFIAEWEAENAAQATRRTS